MLSPILSCCHRSSQTDEVEQQSTQWKTKCCLRPKSPRKLSVRVACVQILLLLTPSPLPETALEVLQGADTPIEFAIDTVDESSTGNAALLRARGPRIDTRSLAMRMLVPQTRKDAGRVSITSDLDSHSSSICPYWRLSDICQTEQDELADAHKVN